MKIRKWTRLTGATLAALLLAPACTTEEGDDVAGKGCNQNSDCGDGYTCEINQALSAQAPTCFDMCLPACEQQGFPDCEGLCSAQCGGGGGGGGDSGGGFGGDTGGGFGGDTGGGAGGIPSGGGNNTGGGSNNGGDNPDAGAGAGTQYQGSCRAVVNNNTGGGENNTGGGENNTGGSGGGGGPSCYGDFSLGQNAVVSGEPNIGEACNGAAPTNCPDGTFINFGTGECVCTVMCSRLEGVNLGDNCDQAGNWTCQAVESTNGNYATLCARVDWGLCQRGGGSNNNGGGEGGSSGGGEGGSSGGGEGGSSGGGEECLSNGTECSFDSDCCSGTCDSDFGSCQ